jgi:hypothetical protein
LPQFFFFYQKKTKIMSMLFGQYSQLCLDWLAWWLGEMPDELLEDVVRISKRQRFLLLYLLEDADGNITRAVLALSGRSPPQLLCHLEMYLQRYEAELGIPISVCGNASKAYQETIGRPYKACAELAMGESVAQHLLAHGARIKKAGGLLVRFKKEDTYSAPENRDLRIDSICYPPRHPLLWLDAVLPCKKCMCRREQLDTTLSQDVERLRRRQEHVAEKRRHCEQEREGAKRRRTR